MTRAILLVSLSLTSLGAIAGSTLEEVNATFRCDGSPIHPFLIAEFTDFFEAQDPFVGMSVALGSTPRGSADQNIPIQIEDAWIRANEPKDPYGVRRSGFMVYRWLGKLGTDIHVVQAANNTGGSGLFMDLLFVQFAEQSNLERASEDAEEPALVMTLVGAYSLGDRYVGEIELSEDGVRVPASESQFGGGSLRSNLHITLKDLETRDDP